MPRIPIFLVGGGVPAKASCTSARLLAASSSASALFRLKGLCTILATCSQANFGTLLFYLCVSLGRSALFPTCGPAQVLPVRRAALATGGFSKMVCSDVSRASASLRTMASQRARNLWEGQAPDLFCVQLTRLRLEHSLFNGSPIFLLIRPAAFCKCAWCSIHQRESVLLALRMP